MFVRENASEPVGSLLDGNPGRRPKHRALERASIRGPRFSALTNRQMSQTLFFKKKSS